MHSMSDRITVTYLDCDFRICLPTVQPLGKQPKRKDIILATRYWAQSKPTRGAGVSFHRLTLIASSVEIDEKVGGRSFQLLNIRLVLRYAGESIFDVVSDCLCGPLADGVGQRTGQGRRERKV